MAREWLSSVRLRKIRLLTQLTWLKRSWSLHRPGVVIFMQLHLLNCIPLCVGVCVCLCVSVRKLFMKRRSCWRISKGEEKSSTQIRRHLSTVSPAKLLIQFIHNLWPALVRLCSAVLLCCADIRCKLLHYSALLSPFGTQYLELYSTPLKRSL